MGLSQLGSKYWQTRWEYQLDLAEKKLFGGPGRDLFTASKAKIREEVKNT